LNKLRRQSKAREVAKAKPKVGLRGDEAV